MVFAVQIVHEFLQFGAGKMIGGIMGMALWRELAPMLTSVVVAGRVGAAISAELGTMTVTEQVEAMEAMSQDPISYLVIPRFVACALMLPLLIGLADVVSFFSGFAIAIGTGRINPVAYLYSANRMLFMKDITGGLFKGVIFGMLIALISTYTGLSTSAGARGVGLSTTKAVVLSLVLIFVVNYFLSLAIFA
jgi:phospholipid/cholesterol/gamma-HCH transport system permease protein